MTAAKLKRANLVIKLQAAYIHLIISKHNMTISTNFVIWYFKTTSLLVLHYCACPPRLLYRRFYELYNVLHTCIVLDFGSSDNLVLHPWCIDQDHARYSVDVIDNAMYFPQSTKRHPIDKPWQFWIQKKIECRTTINMYICL